MHSNSDLPYTTSSHPHYSTPSQLSLMYIHSSIDNLFCKTFAATDMICDGFANQTRVQLYQSFLFAASFSVALPPFPRSAPSSSPALSATPTHTPHIQWCHMVHSVTHHSSDPLSVSDSLHEGHDLLLHCLVQRQLLPNQVLYPLVQLHIIPGRSERGVKRQIQ